MLFYLDRNCFVGKDHLLGLDDSYDYRANEIKESETLEVDVQYWERAVKKILYVGAGATALLCTAGVVGLVAGPVLAKLAVSLGATLYIGLSYTLWKKYSAEKVKEDKLESEKVLRLFSLIMRTIDTLRVHEVIKKEHYDLRLEEVVRYTEKALSELKPPKMEPCAERLGELRGKIRQFKDNGLTEELKSELGIAGDALCTYEFPKPCTIQSAIQHTFKRQQLVIEAAEEAVKLILDVYNEKSKKEDGVK
jgi:hypothetical protein